MLKVELEAKVAALEARIVVATTVYRDQKARIAALEAQLNTRGVKAVAPLVREFTKRDGSVWQATRNGTQTRSVCVTQAPAPAAQEPEVQGA